VKKVVREKSSGWKVEKSAARRKRAAEKKEEKVWAWQRTMDVNQVFNGDPVFFTSVEHCK
jgi:hypothetical protein